MDQKLIVCNYLSKKVIVKLEVKPHARTYIDSFLKDYVSIYDATKSSKNSFGTYFVSLLNQKVIQIPDAYRSKYYFTGKSVGNSYFAVSKNVESMIGIYSYDVPANKLELNKEIKYLDFRELRDLAVEFVLKDKVIFYNSDNSGEKVYSFTNGSVNLLLSSKEEIVDFEFH